MVDGNYMLETPTVTENLLGLTNMLKANSHYNSAGRLAKRHGSFVEEVFSRYYEAAREQTVDFIKQNGFTKLVESYDKEPALHSNPGFGRLINMVREVKEIAPHMPVEAFADIYVACIADSVSAIVKDKTKEVLDAAFQHRSAFEGSFNIGGSVIDGIKFDGNYALAHPKTKSYYLAHAITISTDGGREPTYYADLEKRMAERNIYGFRPALYRPSAVSACLVLFDLVAILHCDHLIMDLTNGLSVGATVEANFAFLCGKQIIAVGTKDVPISEFAKTLAGGTVMYALPGVEPELVAEYVCKKACTQNGRWY